MTSKQPGKCQSHEATQQNHQFSCDYEKMGFASSFLGPETHQETDNPDRDASPGSGVHGSSHLQDAWRHALLCPSHSQTEASAVSCDLSWFSGSY